METARLRNMESGIEIGLDTLSIKGDPSKLYEELAKAQAKFIPVPRSNQGQVGQQKFKYAGYAQLMRCVRPALTEHGIAVFQPLHSRDDMAVTTTILAGHGASITASFSFKAEFTRRQKDGTEVDDPQEFGRHHTYYRRYQLQAMLGIEGDADADDLPDVNEKKEQAQFTDERRLTAIAYQRPEAGDGEAVPAKAPKAQVSADSKSASVEKPTSSSAEPSEPTTNGKSKTGKTEPKPTGSKSEPIVSVKTINEQLTSAMDELKWKMPELKAFFVEHVDPQGFDKAANLTVEKKQLLFRKMVEVHNVTPF